VDYREAKGMRCIRPSEGKGALNSTTRPDLYAASDNQKAKGVLLTIGARFHTASATRGLGNKD
jgi:hypothetical protein